MADEREQLAEAAFSLDGRLASMITKPGAGENDGTDSLAEDMTAVPQTRARNASRHASARTTGKHR